MQILIAATDPDLSAVWARALSRSGAVVFRTTEEETALTFLSETRPDAIILDLMLKSGSPIAIADYANYRWPDARVIFVTSKTFFSDGSIFQMVSNAAALVEDETPPDDLAAIVEYHARAS